MKRLHMKNNHTFRRVLAVLLAAAMTFVLAGCSPRELHIGQVEVNTGVNTAWITPARGVDKFDIPASDFSAGADGSVTYTGTAYRVLQCKQQLTEQSGREPTIDEIARALELAPEQITAAMDAITAPVSLYEPVYSEGGDALTVMDQVRDRKNTDEQWIESITLRDAVAGLSEREKRILALRFEGGRTQMEVAGQIGISQAQVSRLEKSAIRSIRKAILPS